MPSRKASVSIKVIAARPRRAEERVDFFSRLEDDAGGDINTVGTGLTSGDIALPNADKTRVKYVAKTFIEFDANAGLFSGHRPLKGYVYVNELSLV